MDLQRVVGQRFAVDLPEVSLGRILKKLGYSHIGARPRHPAQDAQAIAAFKKLSRHRRRNTEAACTGDANRGVVPEPAPDLIRG